MNRKTLLLGFLCSVLALFLATPLAAADPDPDLATDQQHMREIWTALMAYKKAHGQLPDYLSNLVPDFLPDKGVLLSPREPNKKRGSMDPNLPTSYSYEFSAREFARGGRTFREVKEAQMQEFGPVVPILRCFAHSQVLNVSYSGDYFESALFWEKSPAAMELSKKFGVGPGFDSGDFAEVQVIDDATEKGIAGAEVQLTKRQYHFLPLPDRTLRTDAEGRVRVPLGPSQPPSRHLTVTVSKPSFYAAPETWVEGSLPVRKVFRLLPASIIGGVVKDSDGRPVAGAQVAVTAVKSERPSLEESPDASRKSPATICETDEKGYWHWDSAPKDFQSLSIHVRHAAAWQAEYLCGVGEGPGTIDRDLLLQQTAEFRLTPAAVVSGVLVAPDGSPLAGEDVVISAVPVGPAEPFAQAGSGKRAKPETHLKTDANGRFSMPWYEPAELTFTARPNKFAITMRRATAAPGMEPIQLHASPRRRIAGQVRDTEGKLLAGVRIDFIGWADVSVEQKVATTDADGNFVWDAAPSDQVGFTFSREGFAPSTEWVMADRKEGLKVELRRQ